MKVYLITSTFQGYSIKTAYTKEQDAENFAADLNDECRKRGGPVRNIDLYVVEPLEVKEAY